MKRMAILIYGILCYLMFFGVFGYAILFIGDFWIERTLDSEPRNSLLFAICVNLGLLLAFSIQHSGMARQGFKKWLTKYIPASAERSTYVLMSNLALGLLFAFWEPMGGTIWSIENEIARMVVYGAYFAGWGLLFYATSAICHFDLFGLRQVWLQFRGIPYTNYEFRVPGIYRMVRHPIYVGWLMVIWAAPKMTISHLMFAIGTTAYILIAIRFEERDLIKVFGDKYRAYQRNIPMLIPRLGRNSAKEAVAQAPVKKTVKAKSAS